MKIALDSYMFRHLPLAKMVRTAADLGYRYLELAPRDDFLPFFLHPRADCEGVTQLKTAVRETGAQLASILPLYRWSGPDEDERQAAVRDGEVSVLRTAHLPPRRRRGRDAALRSTWISARATSIGIRSSAPSRSSASTASLLPACSPGRNAPTTHPPSCSGRSPGDCRANHLLLDW